MKKTLLSLLFLASLKLSAQITLFEDSFEEYNDFAITGVGNWTMLDLDRQITYTIELDSGDYVEFENSGSPMAYIVMNPTLTAPLLDDSWLGHTGERSMVSIASQVVNGGNNDWLISPSISLGATGNTLKFWAKGIIADYPEKFKVGVSTTGKLPENFTIITQGTGVTPSENWTEYTYNLDAYQGQNVYIAIQCVSYDAFAFFVDDFKVTAATLSTSDFFSQNFSIYPNPAKEIITLASKNNSAINSIQITDLNGRIVKNNNTNGISEAQINVSDLTSGMYFVTVKTDAGSGTTKLMKN